MNPKPTFQVHAECRIDEPALDHACHVAVDRHLILPSAVPAEHAAGDVPLQAQAAHEVVSYSVQESGDPSAAVLGQDANVGAVQPASRSRANRSF